jgi:hypothetical protein
VEAVTTAEQSITPREAPLRKRSAHKAFLQPEKDLGSSSPQASTPQQTSKSSTSNSTKRAKLFRDSKPEIRLHEPKDNGILWAAYLKGSFNLQEGLTQEQFLIDLAKQFGAFHILWLVEDEHKGFKSGKGPVAIVGITTDGWVFEPKVVFFKWATKRNILRSSVQFFQRMRSKNVGACVVNVTKKDFAYMKHMEKYGVLYLRGKIPNGSPEGSVFVFSIDGEKR